VEKIRRYIRLTREKRKLDGRLKALKGDLLSMEAEVLDEMVDLGVDKVSTEGGTLFSRVTAWARPHREGAEATDAEYEAACRVLIATGMEDLVSPRFNVLSLSARVREMQKNGEPIPPEWDGIIRVTEDVKPVVRF
jgi:hypothetical protein